MKFSLFVLIPIFGMVVACNTPQPQSVEPNVDQPTEKPTDDPKDDPDEKPTEPAKVIELTAEEFALRVADYTASEWHYLGDRPAIIDFTATWCQPCANLAMALSNIARDYAGKIQIYSVDYDQQRVLADAYKVKDLPTMLFIAMEGEPIKHVGYRTYAQLKVMVEDELLKIDE